MLILCSVGVRSTLINVCSFTADLTPTGWPGLCEGITLPEFCEFVCRLRHKWIFTKTILFYRSFVFFPIIWVFFIQIPFHSLHELPLPHLYYSLAQSKHKAMLVRAKAVLPKRGGLKPLHCLGNGLGIGLI